MSEGIWVIIGCAVVLVTAGVLLKLLLDDLGPKDSCPYCSAPGIGHTSICPHCNRALGKR